MTVHVSDRVDYICMYTIKPPGQSTKKQHEVKLSQRRYIDAADMCLIAVAVEKYPRPPEHQSLPDGFYSSI